MAHVCARPPAELPNERLKELIEEALRWVQWAAQETTRRETLRFRLRVRAEPGVERFGADLHVKVWDPNRKS